MSLQDNPTRFSLSHHFSCGPSSMPLSADVGQRRGGGGSTVTKANSLCKFHSGRIIETHLLPANLHLPEHDATALAVRLLRQQQLQNCAGGEGLCPEARIVPGGVENVSCTCVM